jgi:hypothetical protein
LTIVVQEASVKELSPQALIRLRKPGGAWQMIEEGDSRFLYLGRTRTGQMWPLKVAVLMGEEGQGETTSARFVAWDVAWGSAGGLEAAISSLRKELRLVSPTAPGSTGRGQGEIVTSRPQPSFVRVTRLVGFAWLFFVIVFAVVSYTLWEPAYILGLVAAWLSFAAADLIPRRALGFRSTRGMTTMLAIFGALVVFVSLVGTLL